MGLFTRKTPVPISGFCTEHYDQNFYPPMIRGVDPAEVLLRTVSQSIAEADRGFASLDFDAVRRELTLIRFEVFSLGWLHQFGPEHTARQTLCTRQYLFDRDDEEAWDELSGYNEGIATSATFGRSGDNFAGRAFIAMTNKVRADAFDEWHKSGVDADVCARAANRTGVDVAWKAGTTAQFLAVEFANRLRYDWNSPGRQRLEFVIRGFYDGARNAMRSVKIVG